MELFCEAYVPCLQGERGRERDYDKGQIERDQVKGKRERGMELMTSGAISGWTVGAKGLPPLCVGPIDPQTLDM